MIAGIAKLIAYKKAPVRTFAALHPLKAAKWAGIFLVVGTALKRATRGGEEKEGRLRRWTRTA